MVDGEQTSVMVSVLMVTYGHERYIAEAIRGVLMQRCNFKIELIVADDCSPDSTETVVADLLSSHPNGQWVKYTKHNFNKGANENFIWAAQQATGKYIALCEGDDYWIDPLKLQKQVDFMEQNPTYIGCGCYANTDRFGNMEYVSGPLEKRYCGSDIVNQNPFPTLTTMFRNNNVSLLADYNFILGDAELFMFLSQYGCFKQLPFIGAVYRFHGKGTVSGNTYKKNVKRSVLARISADQFFKLGYGKDVKNLIIQFLRKESLQLLKNVVRFRKSSIDNLDLSFFLLNILRRKKF